MKNKSVWKSKRKKKRLNLERFVPIGEHYFLQNETDPKKGMMDIMIDLIDRHIVVTTAVSIFDNCVSLSTNFNIKHLLTCFLCCWIAADEIE